MTLTKAKLAELRRIRDGATTSGRWITEKHEEWVVANEQLMPVCAIPKSWETSKSEGDAHHIATFDPVTTGELLDALERCREALEEIALKPYRDSDLGSLLETNRARASAVLREVFGEAEAMTTIRERVEEEAEKYAKEKGDDCLCQRTAPGTPFGEHIWIFCGCDVFKAHLAGADLAMRLICEELRSADKDPVTYLRRQMIIDHLGSGSSWASWLEARWKEKGKE